ncbi:MAG: hypothetical protein ABEH65_08335 [Halobacteriales archaeon]
MNDPTDDPRILNFTAAGAMVVLAVIGIAALFGYQWLLSQGVPFLTAFVVLCLVELGCGVGFVMAVLNLHESIEE